VQYPHTVTLLIVRERCSIVAMKNLISVLFWSLLTSVGYAQNYIPVFQSSESEKWADSMLSKLSYQQKLGQLFMIDAFSNKDSAHVKQVSGLIEQYGIGGLIFFQGGPYRQAILTNYYQKQSQVPLLIGIDGEWGLQMRLDSTIRFPRQMTLGAGADSVQVFEMGKEIGRQMKRMGIHVNFAPDVDINNNPKNPIINSRSFGESRERVAKLSFQYMKGLQDEGVLACAKHFPGHGDTDTDSHLSLPVVHADSARIDSLELYPYKSLIPGGLGSVMVAHLFVPAVDSTPGRAGTLSPVLVNGWLKKKLGFNGLIFTDALNMKGVAAFNEPGELELKALMAGNDVLLYSENIPTAINRIHRAIQECEIDQSLIDEKVRKLLMVKYWAGLAESKQVDTSSLFIDLNNDFAQTLNYSLYSKSATLLRNKGKVLPLHPYYRDCIAAVAVNDTTGNLFQQVMAAYAHVDFFNLPKDASSGSIDSLLKLLSDYDRIVVSVHNTTINAAKNFNVTPSMVEFVTKAGKKNKSILCIFGNAYVLGKFENYEDFDAVVQAYEDTWMPQKLVAQKLFGAGFFSGRLPVSSPPWFAIDEGLNSSALHVLKEAPPSLKGVNADTLSKIDDKIRLAIHDSMFPGCQVVIAKSGDVIYNKSFGYFTYDKSRPVLWNDLYDIASVTKIASTALACMLLVDRNKLDIDAKASKYLPYLRHTDKKDITIRSLMAHQSGLKSWIPFWKGTTDSSGVLSSELFRRTPESGYTIKVADSIFLLNSYRDSIIDYIIKSPLENEGKYVYSDLGIILLQCIVEKLSGKSIDHFVTDHFYKPLGLWKTGYNPMEFENRAKIVPTENDTLFRKQLIHGFVHDPAAAMMNGVGGHAGVFSNARSLAVIMQMLLNKGEYGGKRYIKPATVDLFTSQAYIGSENRRGLIFDRPDPSKGVSGPTAMDASLRSFGHAGFTGTYAWADPDNQMVFIFLSNRVFPDSSNRKLASSNLRTQLMQLVYDAIKQ
jgi:beta-glucosidase-like glycosyl hydrolase/CubicO group peptidase (beta-lactamase class C family)